MYRRNDPRFRRTLNEISQTLESANESAQANIFSFSHHYVGPCFAGFSQCFYDCTASCFPQRDQRQRRNRARSQARAESSFDFYDDWDEEENDGLLGWGNDEFDSLLSGSAGYGTNTQPSRQRAMSYGTRQDPQRRRKSALPPHDGGPDPTVIPSSSYFGFFGKLTGKLGGGKQLRYKPSAADLQEHPGASRRFVGGVGEPLLEESEEEGRPQRKSKNGRKRSTTAGSGATIDSYSSRGDIFPSDDEDDAVPLDDEFAMVLERRTTNSAHGEASSGKIPGKRPGSASRTSTRTMSSRSTRSSKRKSRTASKSPPRNEIISEETPSVPSMSELKREENRARMEEERDVARKREAAQRLAIKRGLGESEASSPATDYKGESPFHTEAPTRPRRDSPASPMPLERQSSDDVVPFPAFDPPTAEPIPSVEVSNSTEDSHTAPDTEDIGDFQPAQLPRFSS